MAKWRGDSVDISIMPEAGGAVRHFILGPGNVQWDSLDKDGTSDLGYNPRWQSAVHIGIDEWTVEAAIPWSELKMPAPKKGSTMRANLARQRTPVEELTSWSQFVSGFQEVQNLGTWKFE